MGSVLLWLYVRVEVPEREAYTRPRRMGINGNQVVTTVTKGRGDKKAEPRMRS